MESYEFSCLYGSNNTEDIGYFYNGWYCVDGSVNVEELSDNDCFTWSNPITSLKQLIEAVES